MMCPWALRQEQAAAAIRLLMLVNDVSLRNLIPAELAKASASSSPSLRLPSPVAVTPDELGIAWKDDKVQLPLCVDLNGKPFGRANAGIDMTFDFGQLVAHAAKTRPLSAGAIIGSGTVSNKEKDGGPGKPVVAGETRLFLHCGNPHDRNHRHRQASNAVHAVWRHSAHRNEGCQGPFDLWRHRTDSPEMAGSQMMAKQFASQGDLSERKSRSPKSGAISGLSRPRATPIPASSLATTV